MAINIFDQLIQDLAGTQRGQDIEKKAAPILVPLEGLAASALENEVNSLLSHNMGWAVKEMQSGLDKIGLSGTDRTLVEALVAIPLQQLTVKIGAAITPDAAGSGGGNLSTSLENGGAVLKFDDHGDGDDSESNPVKLPNPFGKVGG